MQPLNDISLFLASEDETAELGRWFAHRLQAGDCMMLQGSIGVGKSHFARALIQARLGRAEDVPSPTFTLVQTYQADVDIWHADLYRLSHPDEVAELGLGDAFSQAICLVEWPDRLGVITPQNAIWLTFSVLDNGRMVTFKAPSHPLLLADMVKAWLK